MKPAAACVAVALLLGVTPALAQPSRTAPVPPPYQYQPAPWQQPPPATETYRYGTTVAAVDGLSFGAMVIGLIFIASTIDGGDEDEVAFGAVMMIGGAAGYVFGGPLVHSSKGNTSGAWKSLGLRLGLPLLGGMLGEAMKSEECGPDYCYENEGPGDSFAGIGVITAMVADWFILAKTERPVRYAPYATATGDDLAVGLAGTF